MTNAYRVAANAVYRSIDDEVIAIQVETGVFYHLSASCEAFLDFFARAATLESFLTAHSIDSKDEADYLAGLLATFVGYGLIESGDFEVETGSRARKSYVRPEILKTGEESVQDMLVVMGY